MKKEKQLKNSKPGNPTASYIGFVFQTFLKRPFGYIVSLLYVIYLAVILVIVPKAVHLEPLFIWSNAAFNMPIFNLMFIAAATSSLAVAIFRTGKEDGTELVLSSKPITKGRIVLIKTFVYLVVMLAFCAIITGIVALMKPVFGEYDILNNRLGITQSDYEGLLKAMLIGNLVNMLLFGGIAVLISIVGGQVITMVATIGVAFLMCLMNVIFPMAISSPRAVLNDKYNTSINSLTAYTKNQFNNPNSTTKSNYATIQCLADENGNITSNYDTYKYWNIANQESGSRISNYFDFGKQLSNTYQSFGMDITKLVSANKLFIGANSSYDYAIDKNSWVNSRTNVDMGNYPLAIYAMEADQGYFHPVVYVAGGNMDVQDNWYIQSQTKQFDWDSLIVISCRYDKIDMVDDLAKELNKRWYKMSDLILTDAEKTQSKIMFDVMLTKTAIDSYVWETEGTADSSNYVIISNNNDVFWKGATLDLTHQQFEYITAKIQLAWAVYAQEWQNNKIKEYCEENKINDSFPYSSKTFISWYKDTVVDPTGKHMKNYVAQKQIENIYTKAIAGLYFPDQKFDVFPKMNILKLDYCETYKNLYKYKTTSFYNNDLIVGIWSVIAVGLFTTSVIVYTKIDIK